MSENKAILKAKIKKERSIFLKIIDEFYCGFYELFYFILKNPFENFYWECTSITIQYVHLLLCVIDKTVSKKLLFYQKY